MCASRRTERLDPSKNLKTFTRFDDLIPELRVKIWSHCLVPPGRAVFDHCLEFPTSSFGPDEAVVATSGNFFWKGTPVIFQICRESRYEGKLLMNPVTGLKIFHNEGHRFHPSLEVRTLRHPPAFVLKKLWFSVKDTIEIPIRSSIELRDVETAARQIAQAWVDGTNPLKVRKVQFTFLVAEDNKMSADVVDYLSTISSVVGELGGSVTIFIGMGAGYAHKKGRFYLNDDQENWTYNEDGTLYDQELQAKLEDEEGIPTDEKDLDSEDDSGGEKNVLIVHGSLSKPTVEYSGSEMKPDRGDDPHKQRRDSNYGPSAPPANRRKRLIPKNGQCAVNSPKEAYMYCLNSEIIEEHLAKTNARIKYADQIRGDLVRDIYTGGWERGEAYRLGLSFEKSRLCKMLKGAVV